MNTAGKFPFRFILILLVLMSLSAVLSADTVTLKNGNRLTGRIVKENDSEIVIERKSGKMVLPRTMIKKIIKAPPPGLKEKEEIEVTDKQGVKKTAAKKTQPGLVGMSDQVGLHVAEMKDFSLKIPSSFKAIKPVKQAHADLHIFMGKLRKDGTQPTIFVNEIDISKLSKKRQDRIPANPVKNFDAYLGTLSRKYNNFVKSQVQEIKIDGKVFAAAVWSGDIRLKEKEFNIKGKIYICRDDNMVYQLNYMDTEKYVVDKALNAIEMVFKTVKFNKQ